MSEVCLCSLTKLQDIGKPHAVLKRVQNQKCA